VCADDDSEWIEYASAEERGWARSIGRVWVGDISDDGSGDQQSCTGALVGPDLLLTAGHCVVGTGQTMSEEDFCADMKVSFDYETQGGKHTQGLCPGQEIPNPDSPDNMICPDSAFDATCDEVLEVEYPGEEGSEEVPDYALIRLSGSPGLERGHLEIARRRPEVEEEIIVIAHPVGAPKVISRDAIDSLTASGLITYSADTAPGSSGAPLLDGDGHIIGLAHRSDCYDNVERLYDRHLPIWEIVQASPILQQERYVDASRIGLPEPGDRFGEALAAGDFNGDGFTDVVVGSPGEDLNAIDGDMEGALWVAYGTQWGVDWSSGAALLQGGDTSSEDGDRFGEVLAVGDFNGDLADDLVVGVPREGWGQDDAGIVQIYWGVHWLVPGIEPLQPEDAWTTSAGRQGVGDQIDAWFGQAVAVGDFNGDLVDDLAIGAPSYDDEGRVFINYGHGWWDCDQGGVVEDVADCADVDISWDDPLAALRQLLDASTDCADAAVEAVVAGASECGLPDDEDPITFGADAIGGNPELGDGFGYALAAGDFDGDGRDDLAIGSPGENLRAYDDYNEGVAWVVFGEGGGLNLDDVALLQQSGSRPEAGDYFGASLAAGDFDGDGADDLAIGAPLEDYYDVLNAGAVSVRYFTGSNTGWELFWQDDIVGSNGSGDLFGFALAAAPLGSNDRAELAIGAPGEGGGAGRVNVLQGFSSGLAPEDSLTGNDAVERAVGDEMGHALTVGDLDNDGDLDLLIGTPGRAVDDNDHAGAVAFTSVF